MGIKFTNVFVCRMRRLWYFHNSRQLICECPQAFGTMFLVRSIRWCVVTERVQCNIISTRTETLASTRNASKVIVVEVFCNIASTTQHSYKIMCLIWSHRIHCNSDWIAKLLLMLLLLLLLCAAIQMILLTMIAGVAWQLPFSKAINVIACVECMQQCRFSGGEIARIEWLFVHSLCRVLWKRSHTQRRRAISHTAHLTGRAHYARECDMYVRVCIFLESARRANEDTHRNVCMRFACRVYSKRYQHDCARWASEFTTIDGSEKKTPP